MELEYYPEGKRWREVNRAQLVAVIGKINQSCIYTSVPRNTSVKQVTVAMWYP